MGADLSLEAAYPRTICWIDDNEQNNTEIINALGSKRIRVVAFSTTEAFITYFKQNNLHEAPYSALRIITDMNRTEDGAVKKTAGYDVVNFLRDNKYSCPILIYQGTKSVQRTVQYLQDKKIKLVFVECAKEKALEFASFSPDYRPSYSMVGKEQLDALNMENEPQALDKTMLDAVKFKFYGVVADLKSAMETGRYPVVPNIDLPFIDKIPINEIEWHKLLFGELLQHECFKSEYYINALEKIKADIKMPKYCAVAIRLYTGLHIYDSYLQDLKNGKFDRWKVYTAAIEHGCKFLVPFQGIVWRGTNSQRIFAYNHLQMTQSDFIYVMAGVTSTSKSFDIAKGFIKPSRTNPTMYHLYVNNARDVSCLSEFTTENEILVPIFSAWVVIKTDVKTLQIMKQQVRTRVVRAIQFDAVCIDNEDFESINKCIDQYQKNWIDVKDE